MQIIKVGGSLYHQPTILKAWLAKLVDEAHQETVIVVPGGGPFADTVRDAQQHFDLSDSDAHKLAIAAMCQFGRLLMTLCQYAQQFSSVAERPAAGLSIWLPDASELTQTALAQDWTVSSDSIALWLAQQYQQPLTLLKSATQLGRSLKALTDNQHIDAAFRTLYFQNPVPLRLIAAQTLVEPLPTDWKIFDD